MARRSGDPRTIDRVQGGPLVGIVPPCPSAPRPPPRALGAIHTGGALTRTRNIVIDAGTTGGGRLFCPDGYLATAGGAKWLPDGNATGVALSALRRLAASLPVSDGTGWYVSGYNFEMATDEATLRIVITCLPASTVGSYTVRHSWVEPAGDTGSVKTTAAWGDGRRVVTGGAGWQVPGRGWPTRSPCSTRWAARRHD